MLSTSRNQRHPKRNRVKKVEERYVGFDLEPEFAKKQSSSKTPLTAEQLKNIKYKKTTDKEAEALVNQTDEYS